MESFEDFGLKSVFTVDLFRLFEDSLVQKGQGHYLTFDPGLLKYDNFIHLDPQKPLGQISCSLLGLREQMFAQTVGGHMISIAYIAQIWSKYFQNLLQTQFIYGTDN